MLSRTLVIIAMLGIASAVESSDYKQETLNSIYGSPDHVDDSSLEETGRFGFVTVDSTGVVLTVNATSLLFSALFGLGAVAIAAAIAIPLAIIFGVKKYYYDDEDYSYYSGSGSNGGYGYQSTGSSYTDYAKRYYYN